MKFTRNLDKILLIFGSVAISAHPTEHINATGLIQLSNVTSELIAISIAPEPEAPTIALVITALVGAATLSRTASTYPAVRQFS